MKKLIALLLIFACSTAFAAEKINLRRLGGINTRTSPYELQDYESVDLSNFTLDQAGSITERSLFKRYNTSSIGSVAITDVYKFYKSSDVGYLICGTGKNLYKATGGNLTDISLTANTVVGSQWAFESFTDGTNELVFGVNNDIKIATWDGVLSTFRPGQVTSSSPATNCNILKKHKSRLWASGSTTFPYRIYYSSLNNGLNWTTSGGSFDLPSYEKIMALETLGDILYVFTRNSIYAVVGDTPNEFYLVKTGSKVGTHAYKSIQRGGNLIFFLNKSGIFAFDGSESVNIAETIQPTVDNISQSYLQNSAGLYDSNGKYWLSYTSTNGSYNDTIIIYDTVVKQWYKLDGVNLNSFFRTVGGMDKGELYAGSSNLIGFLWQLQSSSSIEQISHSTQTQLETGVTFNTTISPTPEVCLQNVGKYKTGTIAYADSSEVLLIHFNGADAATTYTTEDSSARTVTFNVDAQLDTAQYKFGTASLLLNGVAGTYASVPNTSDFGFGTNDFTIDFWVRFTATSAQDFMGQYVNASNFWTVSLNAAKKLTFYWINGGTEKADFNSTSALSITTGTWYHIVIERNGSTCLMFLNGESQAVTQTIAFGSLTNVSGDNLNFGKNMLQGILTGWVDEVRINNSTAKYVKNFFVPRREHPYINTSGGILTSDNLQINASGQASLGTITWQENLPTNTDIQLTTRTGATDDSVYYNGWGKWVSTSTVVEEVTSNANWSSWDSPNLTVNTVSAAPFRNILYYESDDNSNPPCISFVVNGARSTGKYFIGEFPAKNLTNYSFVGFWLNSPVTGESVRIQLDEVTPPSVLSGVMATANSVTWNTVETGAWEYHYFPVSQLSAANKDAMKYIKITYLGDGVGTFYLGKFHAYDFLDSGETITSAPNDFIQYKAILGTIDSSYDSNNIPRLINANGYVVTVSYSSSGGTTESSLESYWKSKIFDNNNEYNKLWQIVEFSLTNNNPTTSNTVYMDYWIDDTAKTRLSKTMDVTGSKVKARFYLPSGSYGKSFQFKFYDNDVDNDLVIDNAQIQFVQEGGS